MTSEGGTRLGVGEKGGGRVEGEENGGHCLACQQFRCKVQGVLGEGQC